MFSKACSYGIRALVFIASKSQQGERTGYKEIARAIESPEPFTAKILQNLSRQRLVESFKGPKGGFFLNQQQLETNLYEIVEIIDGPQLMHGCGLGFEKCSDEKPCPLHFRYEKVRASFTFMLENTDLKTLSQEGFSENFDPLNNEQNFK
ncbi:Rrf2 family transcriptional regulator [Persicobacter diffluens]|uniref:HTH-type transcriptional regulator n=1 Tax=Persicobacter diffluens TaxID=981 RepID=A0AAN4W1E6_9BACT|nr:putative HTH-type transcriptional regulator [Persicobacter diffluens]